MLAQDPFTGYFHDVPYPQISGYSQVPEFGQVLYDGLGNPVGGLFDTIKSIVGNIPLVGGLVSSLIPGGAPAPAATVVQPAQAAVPVPIAAPPSPYAQPPSPYLPAAIGGMLNNVIRPYFPLRRYAPPVGW